MDGDTLWVASESIEQSCTLDEYLGDSRPSAVAARTRTALANWATIVLEPQPLGTHHSDHWGSMASIARAPGLLPGRSDAFGQETRLIDQPGPAVGCQPMGHRFESVQQVRDGLKTSTTSPTKASPASCSSPTGWQAGAVEGPAGTGKTQLAKSVAEMTGARLIRLQCYEGLDESKALYEWNYKKQLLRIQADRNSDVVERDPRRHLLRRVPADPAAARGDPRRGSGRAADRRGRPRRGRDRGAAARDPLRLPGRRSPSWARSSPSRSRSCSSRRTTPASCPRR